MTTWFWKLVWKTKNIVSWQSTYVWKLVWNKTIVACWQHFVETVFAKQPCLPVWARFFGNFSERKKPSYVFEHLCWFFSKQDHFHVFEHVFRTLFSKKWTQFGAWGSGAYTMNGVMRDGHITWGHNWGIWKQCGLHIRKHFKNKNQEKEEHWPIISHQICCF